MNVTDTHSWQRASVARHPANAALVVVIVALIGCSRLCATAVSAVRSGLVVAGLAIIALMIGCSRTVSVEPDEQAAIAVPPDSGAVEFETPPPGPTIRRVAADQLPPVGGYLPLALDEGRVRVASPEGWRRAPRSARYLAAFFAHRNVELPRILITAESLPIDGAADVTPENVTQWADAYRQYLDETGIERIEDVLPMVLGENPFARYVTQGRLGNARVERQMLVTVHDGRLYRVELTVLRERILEHRDYAYAVAAAMQLVSTQPDDDSPTAAADASPPEKSGTVED